MGGQTHYDVTAMDQQVHKLVDAATRARSVLNTAKADYPEGSTAHTVIARRMDELNAALAPFLRNEV